MSQLSYNIDMSESFAGLKADAEFDKVITRMADGEINFGRACCSETGDAVEVRYAKKDVASLVYDADIVTANSVIVTVNGVSTAAVVFDTDHDTTMDALLAAVSGLSTVSSASLTDGSGDNRTIRIEAIGTAIVVSTAVTLGATQATGTPTYSSDDLFRGVSVHIHTEDGKYLDTEPVSVMTKGVIWVDASVAVTVDDDAYVDVVDGTGKFTNVSSGNIATGGKFMKTTSAAGLTKLEINRP